MHVVTSYVVPQILESEMVLPEGEIQSFWVSHSKRFDVPQLFVSVLHSSGAPKVKKSFYVITEPQPMENIDSLGEYYGSFDVSPQHQERIIHVYQQLYKDEKPSSSS